MSFFYNRTQFLLKKFRLFLFLGVIIYCLNKTNLVLASNGTEVPTGNDVSLIFFILAIVLLLAKVFSVLCKRLGLPVVLGELLAGVVLGNLYLLNITTFDVVFNNFVFDFLANLGLLVLLFQIGLESDINQMRKVGKQSFLVACVGVICPFVLGAYVISPIVFPNAPFYAHLFLGASLTATSVGISARIFKDLKLQKSKESRIILGAAVIDDILGLIILASVSALVTMGSVNYAMIIIIVAKAIIFLLFAIVIGRLLEPQLLKFFAFLNKGEGMKFTIAISLGLFFAYLAHMVGLEPLVGAFAAGLILDPIHFKSFDEPKIVGDIKEGIEGESPVLRKKVLRIVNNYSLHQIEDIIAPLSYFFVPIFFVMVGTHIKLEALLNIKLLIISLFITLFAIVSKMVAGLVADKNTKRLVIGCGMVARGEVGLVFVMVGKGLGVLNEEMLSVIVMVVVLTTIIAPIILSYAIKHDLSKLKIFKNIKRKFKVLNKKVIISQPFHR